MGKKGDINKYEDFTGTLVKMKKKLFSRNFYYLYLENDEKKIRVLSGNDYIIGQKLKIGHSIFVEL